jgi:hypothetical protein
MCIDHLSLENRARNFCNIKQFNLINVAKHTSFKV